MAEAGIAITAGNGREFTTDKNGYISGEVPVHLSDLIGLDLEGALDMFSERLTGGELLMDIDYNAVRVEGDQVIVEVSGDPSMILERQSEDDDQGPTP